MKERKRWNGAQRGCPILSCFYLLIDQDFFYKNKFYKNTQAEIYPKIKNKLTTITRLKFWSEKFKKYI